MDLAYLRGVEYPATKDDLIKTAADAGASEADLEALRALGTECYDDAGQLRADLAEDGVSENGNR